MFDALSAHGGNAVKLVGDEVTFVADSLPVVVGLGLARADTLVIPQTGTAQLASRDDIEIVAARRTFDFKGIGNTRIASVGGDSARQGAI